ncbi:hypothetical protein M5D96_008341 [Drosophila gunungcola]|uniref:Uncharacterized protein n=1 Tax=Drosophila gunungcola TaxID=103775 RepID=A0A9P9YKK2_9MUSC|nr:hypothetical protein M5D96_008341 [Drosophila gunungcola]
MHVFLSNCWEQRGAQTQSRLAKDAAGDGDGDVPMEMELHVHRWLGSAFGVQAVAIRAAATLSPASICSLADE